MGAAFGGMAQQFLTPLQQPTPSATPQPSGRFTQKTADTPPTQNVATDDPVVTLKKLKEMLDLGLIEQAEYDAKKKEIMNKM